MITIFTPTFNRGYRIQNLFDSLRLQSYKDFEWIVVDDGSTDDTEDIIAKFKTVADFPIIYKKQVNSGKHIAINLGVKLASGNLFFIVDSDDILIKNSLQIISKRFNEIENTPKLAGLVGTRGIKNNDTINNVFNFKDTICSYLDFRYKQNIKGDMAEVFFTSILREYPFPEFQDEKFCTEALVWNRIADKYNFYYFNELIYIGEYLDDGLSSNYWENMLKSPHYSLLYFEELSKYKIPFRAKLKALNAYWGIALNTSLFTFKESLQKVSFILSMYVLIHRKIAFWIKKIVSKT